MSTILSLAPNRGLAVVSVPCGGWSSKPLLRIPSSRRLSWLCTRDRRALRGNSARITACAAPPARCPGFEASAPLIERVGFGGVTFESSGLRTVKDALVFQQARSPELIRVAAYLRAVSFYPFPEGRSEEAVQLHRKMKVADEFSSLKSKVAGLQQGYKRIVCIVALYPLSKLADSSVVKLHPSLKFSLLIRRGSRLITLLLTANPSWINRYYRRVPLLVGKVRLENGEEHVLVGSLDLNQGIALPGEMAVKKIPKTSSASFSLAGTSSSSAGMSGPSRRIQNIGGNLRERGYLSNVCVAPLVRQRGIGTTLLQQAQSIAQLWGIKNLYVHAVSTNEAAVKLYNKGAFTVEKEEVSPIARREVPEFYNTIGRGQVQPRRLLLHKVI